MAVEPPDGLFEPPHGNGAVHHNSRRSHAPWEFVILGLLVAIVGIGVIVGWVWFASKSPERLATADAAKVASFCNTAQQQLQQLSNPSPVQGADRVARIRAENQVLQTMTAAFRGVRPSARTPANALKGWITDWSNVIAARERYAHDLADAATTGAKVRFVLPATGGVKPVTDRMNDFVRENHPNLDACFTDALQIENVEGPRVYKKLTSD